ncbi:MAG: hypothetical protein A2051_06875 [Desulfovibrionales bacterium GWA2_65_9]|nr:MAG: hypothetical protein A2051_06875 [Desulfovibrionales bacterium GWA2_65_9]
MDALSQRNTAFASAERADLEVVRAQYLTFVGTHCREFFDSLPTMIMVLNLQRQVVFANQSAVTFLGHGSVDEVLGKRPGEALGCVNVLDAPSGCGTSLHCRSCGAVRAILAAMEGGVSEGECKLLRREHTVLESLDLNVHATPLLVDGQPFVVFAFSNVSHETRRRSMENIFFHDVLNLAGGISGLAGLLREITPGEISSELGVLHNASQTLVDEILAQRDLLAAESSDLIPAYAAANPQELLAQLQGLYSGNSVSRGQNIVVPTECPVEVIETDARLTQRVLGNMLKNALEAGSPGDTVSLDYASDGDGLKFTVHNAGCMPASVQESIFRRRFSTKGATRGLGTYSMLLLSERYLGGSVGFTSTQQEGTTFFLRLPNRMNTA